MLDANLTAQLSAYLERVRKPFQIVASLDDSDSALEMRSLLEEVAALSPQISLRIDGQAARKPSFALLADGDAAAEGRICGHSAGP